MQGDTAIVTAPYKGTTGWVGAVYVFTRSGSAWSLRQKLLPSDDTSGDFFGWSVALSGATAIVGAYARPFSGVYKGAAYVLARSNDVWSEQVQLTASNGAEWDSFGFAVALSGTTAVVGAPGRFVGQGAAYVFRGSGASWSQSAELAASSPANRSGFGQSLALSGSSLLVGHPDSDPDAATPRKGSVHAFEDDVEVQQFSASDPDEERFGRKLATSGDSAIVGSAKAAYVFVHALSDGSPCAAAFECASGFCVDGVCCESACDGQCQACAESGREGKCAAVEGAPRPGRTACDGAGACRGACDGVNGLACAFPGETTTCGSGACTAGTSTSPKVCDGRGTCRPGAETSCGAYACGADACKTSCVEDGDCVGGRTCVASACVAPTDAGADAEDDASAREEAGVEGGDSSSHDASADAAGSTDAGTEPTDGAEAGMVSDDEPRATAGDGCGCRAAGAPSRRDGGLLVTLAGALAATAARRRRDRG